MTTPSTPPESTAPAEPAPSRGSVDLTRYAWLAIFAAIATIALKAAAWAMTGSVGLLSDAAESGVNLVAAVVALVALRVAAQGATQRFLYGRAKAEYFSAAAEGAMIFVAAAVILVMSADRFIHPRPLEHVGIGLLVLVAASVLNGVVAVVLMRAGRRHRSITLVADGKHLLTDVWTSVGVLVGVGLVAVTGWHRLDAVIAFLVGVHIIVTGISLMSESISGLLDKALDDEDNDAITRILRSHTSRDVTFHGLKTREAGQEKHMNVHIQVPDTWTVKRAHTYAHELDEELMRAVPGLHAELHVEPISDPASYDDIPSAEIPIYPDSSIGRTSPDRHRQDTPPAQ
ncbi:cation diffusion facilitator family transporter [Helcobacillus massiliensis]|uniref:cation diffusion facilitator family transporter n=1 Tax=Helcobacillus massiliensis TaxID=521392 RepID=UPI0035CD2D06